MKENKTHVLVALRGFANIMLCGHVNGFWVSQAMLREHAAHPVAITCEECKEVYPLLLLAEAGE